MRRANFITLYIIMVLCQMVITNYLHISPFLMLSILPVCVLCIPLSRSTIQALLIAFATGLCVDVLSEGTYGINTMALLPVAYARKGIVRLIFGKDHIVRSEDFSFRKNGPGKVALAILLVQTIFLVIYIFADGAGVRPLWFNLVRLAVSLAIGLAVSFVVARQLTPDDRR